MKKKYFFILLGILYAGCEKDDDVELEKNYQFEAAVLGKGLDCGDIYLIDLKNKTGDSEIIDGTYYADYLSHHLKIDGLKIKLNCRIPNNDELSVCTALGPAYPHVIVMDSEKVDE